MGEPEKQANTSAGGSGAGSGQTDASMGGGPEGSGTGSGHRIEDLDPQLVAEMTADELTDFVETGRTGRRNALHDVNQHEFATTSTAGVAQAFQSLSVTQQGASSSTASSSTATKEKEKSGETGGGS